MRVLEKTPDRLRLAVSGGFVNTICEFDRAKDIASITKLFLIVPYRHTRIPLSAVHDASVQRVGHDGAHRYYVALTMRVGRSLRLVRKAKSDAMEILDTIRGFLKIDA